MHTTDRVIAAIITAALLCVAPASAAQSADASPGQAPASAPTPGQTPAATQAPAANPSATSPETTLNWAMSAAQITSTCDAAIKHAKDTITQVETTPIGQTNFDTGTRAVENVVADLNDALIVQGNDVYVAIDKQARDASTDCNEKMSQFGVDLGADPVVYAMAQLGIATATNAPDRKLAELYLENGRRMGAALDPATRAQTTKLFDQINGLEIAFNRTLDEDQTTITISKLEAASLPATFVKTFKPAGDGYVVPVNESTYSQFLENEASADARRRFYVAYFNRGGQRNVDRLAQAVALRDRLAHLLGFDSWAAYQLDAKMAKTPQRVTAFLDQIDSKLLPKARTEMAQLQQLKNASGASGAIQAWDYPYYDNQLIKTKYAVDDAQVREYFPVDKVVPGVFDIYQKLLSVTFHPVTPASAWAPGVLEYSVSDNATGKTLGWFYLDLYPRPGKFSHFASFPMRVGRLLPDGSYQMPISAIIGNWPAGAPGKPALLGHGDVITFFHEFGHLMHSTLSTARYETYDGTNVREDFVEAPSQMLENWMWQPSILEQVSSNVVTGKPLPSDLIKRMIALKHVSDGMDWTNQAFRAGYDMTIHSSGPHVDVTRVWFDLKSKLTVLPAVPGTVPEASFGHLMGGYDAGYYGYLWSRVYAQDMFTVFQKGGLENPAVGALYRKDILEPGGSIEPDQLLRNFLGRDPSYDAFYKDLGIKH